MKKRVAVKVANLVESDMALGVGTGSTVKFFIDELGRLKDEEGLQWSLLLAVVRHS